MTLPGILHRGALLAGLALAAPAPAAIVIDFSYVDQQSPQFAKFKAFVDAAVGNNPGYAFSAADAAYMYKLTGQGQYATLAVQTAEAQVASAEAQIAGGNAPDIAGDQYLDVGPMLEDVALTYDWCGDHMTTPQKTRWANYAEQAVWNVWHNTQAQWGGVSHPWPGWAVNDPNNLYHEVPGVPTQNIPWSLDGEVQLFNTCDIGVYPMPDDDWARGKSGFKAIQFMACGVPVVASPVGINREIIQDGVNGFLASTPGEWEQKLRMLMTEPERRRRMGAAGRRTVEGRYSVQVSAPRIAAVLRQAAKRAASTMPLTDVSPQQKS